MTIREIEEKSGMTRANVRFYEAEGLLKPERAGNGYRNYSEADLNTLLRVRLLRALEFSLEDIKALQAGDIALPETLDRQLPVLEQAQRRIERSGEVCREMRRDGVLYETLDAKKYLDDLTYGVPAPVSTPAQDAAPKVTAPWRRYFARGVDLLLYGLILRSIIILGLRENPSHFGPGTWLLITGLEALLMLLLEPPFLHLLGATPGKWLLGLSVWDAKTGGRLSYGAALSRTKQVLWSGYRLMIPIYSLIRLWKCKKICEEGGMLTAVSFHVEIGKEERIIAPSYVDEMLYSVLAFARAQPSASFTGGELREAIAWIQEHPHESFHYTINGIDVACDLRYSGYLPSSNHLLFAEEGAETEYSLSFSLRKR